MLFFILFVVFGVCVAMLWNEGLWSNAITLINVILAGLVATNYFEPVALFLDNKQPTYTYLWDFLSLWFLFFISLAVMRSITDIISKHKVRFKMPVEFAGRALLGIWVGWVMVCFTTFTLNTAPLDHDSLGGIRSTPAGSSFLFFSPDKQWLAFAQSRSRGALSRGELANLQPYQKSLHPEADAGRNPFDPNSDFIFKYRHRRKMLSQQIAYRVNR